MKEILLVGEKREFSTKSHLNSLRKKQSIPGIVYGGDKENQNITVEKKEFLRVIHGESGLNTIIVLKINGSEDKVLVQELQRDVISREVIHVDFHRIDMTEKIVVKVPVHLNGNAVGHEMGGVVDHVLRELEVECLPVDIPAKFEVDVTKLNIGDAVLVKEIPMPSEVRLLTDIESIVVHVVTADKEEPKPEPAAEELSAEPEVIAKGKEKEGAEAVPAPKDAKKEEKPKSSDKEKK
ncbi:MAG: 50S ribosomal protein L25 [bacterium]